MFKSRRMPVRRSRESHHYTGKSNHKLYKLEGNSNITSNRVTIPPGFLCLGVGSRAVRRSPYEENLDPNRNFILNENLHGFFNNSLNENYYKPRRSSRISKKIEGTQNCDSVITSQYYCKGLNSQKSDQLREESNKNPPKGNCIVRNNSKSLFRKINERCARAKAKNSNNFNYPISTVANSNSKVERFCPSTFSLNLSREICVDLNQSDYLLNTRLAIKKKIRDVNDRLVGKMNTGHTTPKRNEQVKDGGDQNDFHYVPKCNWVYETPPRQKVVLPRVEKCAIQPAVICTAKKQSNIYELHQSVNVDLSEYINRQNVEVDRRYMRRVASFDEKVETDLGFHVDNVVGSHHMDMGDAGCSFLGDQRVEEEFMFSNSQSMGPQLFSNVTCRPTKTVKKMSRINKLYTRKSKEDLDDTPTGRNLFRSIEELERDITFVEDDGKYRIVSSQASKSGNNFNFKFMKNLFEEDDGKLFNFDSYEPNMFDFTRMKDN